MEKIELSALQQLDGTGKIPPLPPENLPGFREEVAAFTERMTAEGLSFHELPFALPEEMDPAGLAEGITRFFYRIRDREGPVLSMLWQQLTGFATSRPELAPLRDAGERVAADFDRGLGAGLKNAYHNRQHTVEVLTCAHVLTLLDGRSDFPLDEEARLLLLLAALIHDWHHDGGINGGDPFRLEKIAVKAAKPYLSALTSLQQLRLDLMVRTTDVGGPHQFARTALAYQRLCTRMAKSDKRPPAPDALPGYEYLNNLTQPEHAVTVEIAALLRDADVLPSAGLTADYAALNSSRLRDERAAPYAHADFAAFLNNVLARPRTSYDERPPLPEEKTGVYFSFASRPGQYFNPNLPEVIRGHARLMEEMGEEPDPEEDAPAPDEPTVDLSVFEEAKQDSEQLGDTGGITLEEIEKLRITLRAAGYFDAPPFTTAVKSPGRSIGPQPSELMTRLQLAEQTADTLQRLHAVSGPVMSVLVGQLFDTLGLKTVDAVYQAAIGIAREIDDGKGTGTLDDDPAKERNPYHNHHHIIDLLLLCDLLGQRATQRGAPASSPLARGLLLLGALVCHWHHTSRGNRIDGQYRTFHMQDRALGFTTPHTDIMSKELRASLEILVRATDPREPYVFAKAAYAFHVGLGPKPDVPDSCQPLARLLSDPALCTLTARLNDVIFVPFCGLGAAYSARSIVQMGREVGQPIDFNFVRKNLIGPMLSRLPYPGEKVPPALLVGQNRVASFTSSEAQAIFNPNMHTLLVSQARQAPATPRPAAAPAPSTPEPPPPAAPPPAGAPETPAAPEEPAHLPVPATATPPAAPAKPADPFAWPDQPQKILGVSQPSADNPAARPHPVLQPPPAPPEALEHIIEIEGFALPVDAPESLPALSQTETPALMPPEPAPSPPAAADETALLEPPQPMVMEPEPIMILDTEPEFSAPVPVPPAAPPPGRSPVPPPAVTPAPTAAPPAPSIIPHDGPSARDLIEALRQAPPQPTMVMVPPFPYFRYHPDPIASGVVKPTDLPCIACGQVRGFSYFGPVHEATLGDRRLCPWCIADGLAHAKFGCLFVDPQPLLEAGLKPEIIIEVTRHTPGYQSWQRDRWLTHCQDACVFSGDASPADVQQAPASLRRSVCEYYDVSEKTWMQIASRYAPGGDPGIYRFTCRHCGDVLFGWDCT